jgi:hypothetical protein
MTSSLVAMEETGSMATRVMTPFMEVRVTILFLVAKAMTKFQEIAATMSSMEMGDEIPLQVAKVEMSLL